MIDFRHLNIRITKNNLAYPLVSDTFSSLGNSKCEVLLVYRFERCISFIKTFGRLKEILWYITIFQKCIIYISENAYGSEYLTFNLAVLNKCNFKVPTKLKILGSNYG